MNNKIFASALIAAAAFVSSIASAAITYQNSNQASTTPATGYVQSGNALVAPGGAVVQANDLVITSGGGSPSDIPADAEIIIRLPAGLNFNGNPSYLVSPATPTQGLTLKDGTEFGDPTLDDPGITLNDTNGDGGMDRALVTVGAAANAGDQLIISMEISATTAATAGAKQASIIVNNGLAVTQDVATVTTGFTTPVFSASGTKLTSVDQSAQTATVTAAKFTVTLPAGTAGGAKLTMTPQSKLTFSPSGTNATYTVSSPVASNPFTTTSVSAAGAGTPSISFTVAGASTYTLPDDVQVTITIDEVATEAGGVPGLRGLAISGAVTGTAALVDVKANGSVSKLVTGAKATDIVKGSSVVRTLPSFSITENFDGDAIDVGGCPTCTITITPGAGLKFAANTSTIAVSGTGWALTGATVSSTTGKLTLSMTNAAGGSPTVTVSGVGATATSTASGALTMTVGSPGSPDQTTAPNNTLTVANAVDVGTVSVTGPKTPATTGPSGGTTSSNVTLKETTYGALTIANQTDVQDAYFRITPSNASISAVAISFSGYAAGTTPTIAITTPCYAETNVTTGAWICEVEAESTAVTPGTSTITVGVSYAAKSTAAIGSTIDLAFDGNAGVNGTVTVANVGQTTKVTKGVVPDLTPGSLDAENLATVTITELFTGAVTATGTSSFRLIAPSGVAFQDAATISASSATIGTVTITATFTPNDTLVINNIGTATISFTPKAVIASGLSGWLSFDIVDGDINGDFKTNISAASVMLAYADGTLGDVDAGADGSVNVNFQVSNTVDGGLAPYTVKSSDTAIATAAVNGDVVTVTGASTGNAIITVTDELGGSDTYTVAVSAGAAQPAAEKGAKTLDGSATTATFLSGASSDGGDTYGTEFTTADEVTIVATVNVDAADQGKDGEIHVAIKSDTAAGISFGFLNESGDFEAWDLTVAGLGAAEVATPLGSTYNLVIFKGNLAAGTHRIALAYSTEDGDLVYTGKAVVITVTE